MKKLSLIISFLFCIGFSFAQFTIPVAQDNPLNLREFRGAIHPDLGFILPFLDTLNNPASSYNGAVIQNPIDSRPYISDGVRWIPFLVGSAPTQINFTFLTGKYLTDFNTFGTLITDSVAEGTLLYFNNTRARAAISAANHINYNSTTGVISFGTINTDTVIEAGNLYFTPPRSRASISSLSPINYNSGTGVLSADTAILATQNDILSKWDISGNSSTTSANFIGTTDNVSLRFKVNGKPYGFLDANLATANVGFGDSTLVSMSSGSFNTAFGNAVLRDNTSGAQNTGVGGGVLRSNITGNFNTAVGTLAMASNTGGLNNVAIGGSALRNSLSGNYTVAIGARALINATGSENIGIGQGAAEGVTAGDANTIIGENAWLTNNTRYTTAIGHGAGQSATGDSSVFIGSDAGKNSTGNNKLYIANTSTATPLIYGNFRNPFLSINGGGGGTDSVSSIFSINSITKGVLLPRMNGAQMVAITSPANGLMIYNIDSAAYCFYNGSSWVKFGTSTGGGGGGGSGTVTSIAMGYGLTGPTITNTGTLVIDTSITGLSTRLWRQKGIDSVAALISAKVNISDTSSMLSKYLRKTDTATLSNRINLKVNISDTASMLSTYLRKTDTASLSTRIDLKQNLLNGGTGFVKSAAGVISYDNNTYLTAATVATKVDSVVRKNATSDTIVYVNNANTRNFGFKDRGLVDSVRNISPTVQRTYSGGVTYDNVFQLDSIFHTRDVIGGGLLSISDSLADITHDWGMTGNLRVSGSITIPSVGGKILITEGSNRSVGSATLVAGTVTIATSACTTSSRIFTQLITKGAGNTGAEYIVVAGSGSFVLTSINTSGSTATTDTSTLNFWIIN